MKSLRSSWSRFEKRLSRAREKILFLDFDGTLAPIAKTPESVRLSPQTARVLEKLSRKRGFRLVIVSGRSLQDLKRYLRLPKAVLVGNHGLETHPSSFLSKSARRARRFSRNIGVLATKLALLFDGWPGVRVENKTYTLSLHFRALPPERQSLLRELIEIYQAQTADLPLAWKPGKKVWEVRPAGHWGKTDVAAHFMRKFPKAFPIAAGDDAQDEEMFEAIGSKGLTVHVGRTSSSADCFVRTPRELRAFLERLCRC